LSHLVRCPAADQVTVLRTVSSLRWRSS
jgi:hypothetical protein